MKNSPIRCTVGVLTYNSEAFLERCLRSLSGFAEVLVSDGGSTDNTLDIARKFGCTIMEQSNPGHPISDFSLERNRMLDAAKEDWFFYLDSDEVLSQELKEEMRAVCSAAQPPHVVYLVPWKITNKDMSVVYKSFKTYRQPRFFNKLSGARFERKVHERIRYDARIFPPGILKHPWYVSLDIQLNFATYKSKVDHRIRLMVEARGASTLFKYMQGVVYEPLKNIAKQLIKFVYLHLRHSSKELPPKKYELYKLYSQWVYIKEHSRQYARRLRIYAKTFSYTVAYMIRCVALPLQKEPEVAVLMYHMVDASGARLAVCPEEFEWQISYISKHCTLVTAEDVVKYVRRERMLPRRCVAITFDDGYRDVETTVLPILKKYNAPATIFIPSDFSVATDKASTERLTKEAIERLSKESLLTFGSHGRSHIPLAPLNEESLFKEIIDSRKELEKVTGTDVLLFSYPYGIRSDAAEKGVAQEYRAGFAITEGLVQQGDIPTRVKRIQVDSTVSRALFKMRLTRAIKIHRWVVSIFY